MRSIKLQMATKINHNYFLWFFTLQFNHIVCTDSWAALILQIFQFNSIDILIENNKFIQLIASKFKCLSVNIEYEEEFIERTNSPGSVSRSTCLRYVTLFGVHWYIFWDSTTHVSITISGRSENSRMQSLKHELNKVVFSCCNIDIPTNNGYELSPKSSLSHRWMILCKGKTSTNKYQLRPFNLIGKSIKKILSDGLTWKHCQKPWNSK